MFFYKLIIVVLLSVPSSAQKCGIPSIEPEIEKIVGGRDAKAYSWPWQVALFKKPFIGLPFQFCAGSLISNEWIVTAGHCFHNADKDVQKYTVKVGVYDKSKNDEDGELVLGIKEIYVHPRYGPAKNSFDIALLKVLDPKLHFWIKKFDFLDFHKNQLLETYFARMPPETESIFACARHQVGGVRLGKYNWYAMPFLFHG